jgi:hypothetical protein
MGSRKMGSVLTDSLRRHELQGGFDVLAGDVEVVFQRRLNGVPAVKSPADRGNNPLFPALRSGPSAVSGAPAKSKFLAVMIGLPWIW